MTPNNDTGALTVEDVSVHFGDTLAVTNASLNIEPGEFVCLLGPSGCGKSTLLNVLAGFIRPSNGHVYMDGRMVTKPGPERGMVFQHHSLLPWKRVIDNVAFGPRMTGDSLMGAEQTARTFLSMVGLEAHAFAKPHELSGGMKQRVGIARALANYPAVLLMDEPFGALDAQTRGMLQQATLELWESFKTTVVFVTHDVEEAILLADTVYVMGAKPGRIAERVKVTLDRPRPDNLVTSNEFVKLRRTLLDLVTQETMKARDA